MSFSLFSYSLKTEDVKAGFVISVWESKKINYVIEVMCPPGAGAGGALPPPVERHRGAGGGGGGVPPDQEVDTGVGDHLR